MFGESYPQVVGVKYVLIYSVTEWIVERKYLKNKRVLERSVCRSTLVGV